MAKEGVLHLTFLIDQECPFSPLFILMFLCWRLLEKLSLIELVTIKKQFPLTLQVIVTFNEKVWTLFVLVI